MTTKQTKPIVKNRFSPQQRVITESGEGAAQQHFKELCDLNRIMAKFEATRTISHYAKTPPEYTIVPAITLQEAMNTVARANSMFEELPAKIRQRFSNDPTSLATFLDDPNNHAEAITLGILPEEPVRAPEEPIATNTGESKGAVGLQPDAPPEAS
jgi:phage internal scaffolding protein